MADNVRMVSTGRGFHVTREVFGNIQMGCERPISQFGSATDRAVCDCTKSRCEHTIHFVKGCGRGRGIYVTSLYNRVECGTCKRMLKL